MPFRRRATVLAAAAGLAAGAACAAWAQEGSLGALDGLFSRVQAARGGQVFAARCAGCHNPAQAAQLMITQGGGETLAAYLARLDVLMPPEGGERPSERDMLDIAALLMREAGAAMGRTDARVEDAAWREAAIPADLVVDPDASVAGVAPAVEWTAWRGDNRGQGYSTAALIDRDNAADLEVAWRFSAAPFGPAPEARNITTPLMVGGALYLTAGTTRNVVALDAVTGQIRWMWRPPESAERYENAPRKGAGRGVAYWTDGEAARIFTVTPGFHLAALDAATGLPDPNFGAGGVVDLMVGLRNAPERGLADIGSQSPPLVVGDIVVVGPAHAVSVRPPSRRNVKGDVRGYDARTGALLWTFHTIPEPGEPGAETWEGDSLADTGNAGVWAPMSADAETGAIFLGVEAATSDLYGGQRPGANLYSSSLVSLDGRTGELRWAQQLIHHDIWDWDPPTIPILADVEGPDRPVRAVFQLTKQAFVYAFDRDTGAPIWPIEERPVPASDVPGESTSPTQPFPTLPAPFDRQGVTVDDLIDFTPELRAEALEAVADYRLGPFFAPPSLADAPDGTRGTLMLPGPGGGANWEGGVFDPETGVLYVGSSTSVYNAAIGPAPEGSDMGYMVGGGDGAPSVRGLPLIKPPYSRITAIDMNSGAHLWMTANGDTPEAVANHPDLAGLDLPRTGARSRPGLLVTPTLLFSGEGAGGAPVFRAHDKATGEILAEIALPGAQMGSPMTYVWSGRQYIVMSVGDGRGPAEIVALSTPR